MILKLNVSSTQLDALHECLADPDNYWVRRPWNDDTDSPKQMSYVWIKSVKGGGSNTEPVPGYEVVLEVAESCEHESKQSFTPLGRLTRVLHAVGLFPVEDGKPIS
jgi:hypothetical protein